MKAVRVLLIILLAAFSYGAVNAQTVRRKAVHHKKHMKHHRHHHGKKHVHPRPHK
ncbi:MAG TPA: hypothetical protein VIM55_13290 [Mucilaginibacter sp.]